MADELLEMLNSFSLELFGIGLDVLTLKVSVFIQEILSGKMPQLNWHSESY